MKNVCLTMLLIAGFACATTFAQPYVRPDDHFWRKRVVQRVDLGEKINRALVDHQSTYYSHNRYTETDGLVAALLNGLEEGKYLAYDPYDWEKTYTYDDVELKMREFENAWYSGEQELESDAPGREEGEWASGWDFEEFGLEDTGAGEVAGVDESTGVEVALDLSAYEEYIHIVEDWVFDKARSDMVYQTDFFQVIWADPTGMLPDKVLANFMWRDVAELLDKTQWKNRFNDAEARSIKEVIELRLFNGYIIDLSGKGVRSLQEAEQRKQELIEFEHHLWSY